MNATMRTPMLIGSWSLPNTQRLGGAIAGAWIGAITLLLSPILSALHGMSGWAIPNTLAATVLGSAAAAQSATTLLIGALLYLAVSVLLGVCFGLLYRRVLRLTTDFGLPMYIGLVYGLLLFLIAYFAALPALDPALAAADRAMGPLMALATVFGVGLGALYSIIRPAPYALPPRCDRDAASYTG